MSRNPKIDYTQYVHEFENKNGEIRYAVGEWEQENGQYTCPMTMREIELTGCHTFVARTPAGLGGYKTRKQALRRARYLFAQDALDLALEGWNK